MKKLYRSETNKVFSGIVGGLGEYSNTDPVILRLVWLIVVIFTGVFPGVIAYLLALLVVPRNENVTTHVQEEVRSCKGRCAGHCDGNGGCGKEECTCKRDNENN